MTKLFSNFSKGVLAQAAAASDTTLYVDVAGAALLPALGVSDTCKIVVWNGQNSVPPEIINVTAIVGQTLTVQRAQESTTARAWSAGSSWYHSVTAADIQTIVNAVTPINAHATSVSNSTNDYTATIPGPTPGIAGGFEVSWFPNANSVVGSNVRLRLTDGSTTSAFANVVRPDGTQLRVGDLLASFMALTRWDSGSGVWRLVSLSGFNAYTKQTNQGQVSGFRNQILNGSFRYWPDGAIVTTPTSGGSGPFSWAAVYDGTIGAFTLSQTSFTPGQTDVPGEPQYYCRWDQSSAGSGSTIRRLRQRVANVRRMAGRNGKLSVWLKADSARTITGSVYQHMGSGGSPSSDVLVSTANWSVTTAWQQFSLDLAFASLASKAFGSLGDDAIELRLDLPLNVIMTIDVADVQLETGAFATDYEREPDSFGSLLAKAPTPSIALSLLNLSDYGGRNFIGNGEFKIAQRGTTFAAASTNVLDRWSWATTSGAVTTVSRSTDVPTLAQSRINFTYSIDCQITTADASIAAGDLNCLWTAVEGLDWIRLRGRPMVLSFWIKAKKTGNYSVGLLAPTTTPRAYTADVAVNAADTWEYKTIIIPALSTASGAVDTGTGLRIAFVMAAGTTYQLAPNSWAASAVTYNASTNQINAVDSTANYMRIAGVQLEAGVAATLFEQKRDEEYYRACLRYYYRMTVSGTAMVIATLQAYATSGAWGKLLDFKVPLRTDPNGGVTSNAPVSNAGHFSLSNSIAVLTACNALNVRANTETAFVQAATVATTPLVAGDAAALTASNAGAYIEFAADLV